MATGQEAIDGLIQAFGRRARWQALVSSVRSGSDQGITQGAHHQGKHRDPADRYASVREEGGQVTQGAVQQDPGRALGSVHHLAYLA